MENTADIKATAALIMDLAIELQTENAMRLKYKRPELNDWIVAAAAAVEIAQRKAS